ncbi:MAG: hypothetical protein CK547_00025 [Chitinophagaceae bacterium]|nr:MAG: hypothetical protein CK547_00025 [Chitinophagaceae bacterium]
MLVFSAEDNSSLVIKNNAFFNALMKQELTGYAIASNIFSGTSKSSSHLPEHHFIKVGTDLILLIDQGGVLYKAYTITDSLIRFKRINKNQHGIDATRSYVYSINNELYIQGGYADGQNNGTLKTYNRKTNHWEIIPLNKQVIHQYKPFELIWLDALTEKILVPFQAIVNDGIIEDNKLITDKKTYSLDLKTSTWSMIGKINKKTLEILNNIQFKIDYDNGILVSSKDIVYLIDFKTNQLMQMNQDLSAEIIERIKSSKYIYAIHDKLYSLDATQAKYDSILIDKSNFSIASYSVYDDFSNFYYPLIPIGIMLMGGIFLSRRRKKTTTTQKNTADGKIDEVVFTEAEIALIELLLTKSKKNKTAVISEINYVLGIKDKNTGLQKKVRSETINSINEKVKTNLQSEELIIQSIRSEIDKRYLEYLIKKEAIKEVENMIK